MKYLINFTAFIFFILALLLSSTNYVDASPQDDEIEVEGLIQALSSDSLGTDSLIVNNLVFYADSSTEIKGEHGSTLSFSDLQVGDFVEVEADIMPNGKFLASEIEVENDNHFNEFEVEGYIDSLGMDLVYVGGQEFVVTSQTMIKADDGTDLTFADLSVGMFLEIKALLMSDGSFWAIKIKIEGENDHDFEFTGTIDSIGLNTISVNGFTVVADSNTMIVGEDHQILTFSELVVGLRVEIKARIINNGRLLATEIKVEDDFENEIEITGSIDTIYSNIIIVSGFEFWTDSNTVILDNHRDPIMLSDLLRGMIVEVKSLLQNDGSIYASRIKIEDFWRHDIEFEGVMDSIGMNWLTVARNRVYVDSNTVILDNNRLPINFNDLSVGVRVEVKAFLQNDGSLMANLIKIEDDANNHIEFYGTIDSLNSTSVFISGVEFYTDAQTLIFNHANMLISFSDLQLSMFIEIKAVLQANGGYLALKIKIEDDPNQFNTTGILTGISNQSIYISNTSYQIDTNTVVLDSAYQVISINDLTLGSELKAWIDINNSSNPTVLQIKLETRGTLTIVDEEQTNTLPQKFELGQNYPNPFNPNTTIPVVINGTTKQVILDIYNVLGQKVNTIFNGILQNGAYQFTWNGLNSVGLTSPSGVYFYKLTVGKNQSQIKRMILIK